MKIRAFLIKTGTRMKRSSPRGMTLIELLIVVAISSLIMIALLELYTTGQKYFFNQNSRADAIQEGRVPIAGVSRDIRDAQNVVNGPIVAFNGITYSSSENTLILSIPKITGTGISYIIYDYDSTNHRLMRIVDKNTGDLENRTRVMADDLIDDGSGVFPFKLKYFRSDGVTEVESGYADNTIGAFIVEVELTTQGRSIQRGGQPFLETVRTQAKLRNKNVIVT